MKNYIITQLLTSKKVWLGISSIVIPMIASALGVDEATATNLFYACLTLVLGQGIADSARK